MRLTESQRDFAAAQHSVVVNFLASRHLSEDEYYDIVIFPYLEAVAQCENTADIDTFTANANEKMSESAYRHRQSLRADRTLSLDYALNKAGTCTLYDIIPDGTDICGDYCIRETEKGTRAPMRRVINTRRYVMSNGDKTAKRVKMTGPGKLVLADTREVYEAAA